MVFKYLGPLEYYPLFLFAPNIKTLLQFPSLDFRCIFFHYPLFLFQLIFASSLTSSFSSSSFQNSPKCFTNLFSFPPLFPTKSPFHGLQIFGRFQVLSFIFLCSLIKISHLLISICFFNLNFSSGCIRFFFLHIYFENLLILPYSFLLSSMDSTIILCLALFHPPLIWHLIDVGCFFFKFFFWLHSILLHTYLFWKPSHHPILFPSSLYGLLYLS